jgi:hypothetical protein
MSKRIWRDFWGWQESISECCCGWKGQNTELRSEYFGEVAELYCPKCEARLGLVSLVVGLDSTVRAAALGNEDAIQQLTRMPLLPKSEDANRESGLESGQG